MHDDLAKQTQDNSSVTQFTNKFESLIVRLIELQIAELGSHNGKTDFKMNDEVALSTFKNDLNSTKSSK